MLNNKCGKSLKCVPPPYHYKYRLKRGEDITKKCLCTWRGEIWGEKIAMGGGGGPEILSCLLLSIARPCCVHSSPTYPAKLEPPPPSLPLPSPSLSLHSSRILLYPTFQFLNMMRTNRKAVKNDFIRYMFTPRPSAYERRYNDFIQNNIKYYITI